MIITPLHKHGNMHDHFGHRTPDADTQGNAWDESDRSASRTTLTENDERARMPSFRHPGPLPYPFPFPPAPAPLPCGRPGAVGYMRARIARISSSHFRPPCSS